LFLFLFSKLDFGIMLGVLIDTWHLYFLQLGALKEVMVFDYMEVSNGVHWNPI
jgi:hypothetical protein